MNIVKELQLTLYDILGYFIPGTLTMVGVIDSFNLYSIIQSLFKPNIPSLVIIALLILLCYLVGHVLHAIANITIDRLNSMGYPPRNYFEGNFQQTFGKEMTAELANRISKVFKLSAPEDAISLIRSSYWLCYTFVNNNSKNSLVPTFLSLSGFYRGLSISFALLLLLTMPSAIILGNCNKLIWSLIYILCFFLFLRRSSKFLTYLADTVYADFLGITMDIEK